MFIISFCVGVICLLFFHSKIFLFLFILLLLLISGILTYKQNKQGKYVAIAVIGICYASIFSMRHLSVPNIDLYSKPMVISGIVASIPKTKKCISSFLFQTTKPSFKVLLSHYGCDNFNVKPGEKWQFLVKLKPIHGLHNPGSFDLEKWAYMKNIKAKGYIKKSDHNLLIMPGTYNLRYNLYQKLMSLSYGSEYSNLLASITLGIRSNLSAEQWVLFRNTGTSHLIAISGLHVGMVAAVLYFIFLFVGRRFGQHSQLFVAQDFAMIMVLVFIWSYCFLAGLSLPTLRAAVMLSVFFAAKLFRYKVSPWMSWQVAMAICLLLSPLQIFSAGFWLSFFSVAWLLFCFHGRVTFVKNWKSIFKVQCLVIIGLLPLGLFFFDQFSLISPLANLIAIPYLSVLVLPLALFSELLLILHVPGAFFLLHVAILLLKGLCSFLQLIISYFPWQWYFHLSVVQIIMVVIGFVILFAPRGLPGKYLGLLAFIPIFYNPNTISNDFVRLTMLDVGQGLSMVVQTRNHVLVYDTGASFLSGGDMGQSVVIPYLHSQGINHVNLMLISHGDNDHSGGAQSLLQAIRVDKILTSVPQLFSHAQLCLQGEHWQWDGVKFEMLYPDKKHIHKGNNSSCVLKVSAANQTLLLTGDIEEPAEQYLVKHFGDKLNSTILQVPHHGSKTSSIRSFVYAVNPEVALFSYGFQNKFNFPNSVVTKRYTYQGSKLFNTASRGAIVVS